MAKTIPQLEEASALSAKDQFLFYSNTKKKTMRVSRDNMLGSPGVAASIPGVSTVDSTAPGLPQNLVLTSSSSIRNDGTEDIIITAKITPNADADLEGYSWYILEIDVAPVFSGGVLVSGGTSAQTPTYEKSAKNNEGGYAVKVFRAVKANKWYLVKVAAVDKSGNYSSYTATNTQNAYVLTTKDSVPPSPPILHGTNHATNPSTAAIKSVFLRWTNPTDSDLARIDIYRADGPSFTTYNKIGGAYGTAWTDSSSVQGTAYRYKLKAVDYSGNESAFSTVSPDPGGGIDYVQITPGQIDATDVKDFAITATKRWNNTIVLENDVWTNTDTSTGTISWNQHDLYYQGTKYTVSSGSATATVSIEGQKTSYVYVEIPLSGSAINYQVYNVTTAGGYPTLNDNNRKFMIATNVNGIHDLAWNAMANAIIGSAWIQAASITTAQIKELSADKITAGIIDSDIITLGESGASQGIIKSSGATSATVGTGFWIQGGASPVFAIGNLAGAPSMRFASGALTVKGTIQANDGFFGTVATNGVVIDSSGLSIVGDSTNAGNNARLRANLEWNNTNSVFNTGVSGFYLGKAGTSGGSPVYRFFIGDTGSDGLGAGANNLYWNGTSLIINGSLGGNIRSGTTVGTAGDNTYGLTIQSGFGLRYHTNAGVLTITGGTANGAVNAAQIDLAGNSYANVNRGALVLSAGYVDPWPNSPSDINSGAIHFRTKNELVGLWRSNKTFEIYSDVSIQTNLYVGNADPAQAPFKVVSGVITATGANINGAVINGASTIGGRTASTIAGAINASGDFVNDIINARFDTENADILAEFSFGASGALQIGSYVNGVSGDIRISPNGITARNSSGATTFTLNGTTGAATFGGELSAPTGNIGGWTINASSISGGSVTIDSVGNIRAGKVTYADANSGFWLGKDTADANKIKFFIGSSTENLKWDGTDLSITGSISANGGDIAGWIIGADNLSKNNVTISSTGFINLGTGNDIVKLSSVDTTYRIWVGDATAASAPFRVSKTGVVTANGAVLDSSSSIGGRTGTTISGTINSSGDITTTSFNTSTRQILETFQFPTDDYDGALKAGNIVWNSGSGAISSGSGVVIYRGGIVGATNGAVKFSIDASGNATFAGQLSAPTGNIGGWTIGASSLYGGSSTSRVGLEVDAVSGNVAIYAGSETKATAPFRVTNTGNVTATSGTVGGWTLSSNALTGGSTSTTVGLEVDSTSGNIAIYAGGATKATAPFRVSNTGALTCTNVTLTGYIIATSGFIGTAANGFVLQSNYFYRGKASLNAAEAGVYIGTDGISLGLATTFKVTSAGALTATSATITGAITATSGFIGNGANGFAINNTYIGNGKATLSDANAGVYVGTDGIALGANSLFKVTSAGALTATSGTIGGWTLAASKLSAGNIEIDATAGAQKIQAGPSAANYVRISSAGIIGVDSVLGTVFNLPTNGSAPTFSSGEITKTRFTIQESAVIETSSTAGIAPTLAGGVRINSAGIKGFKSGDANPVFFLDATNGDITAKGGEIAGWTIASATLSKNNVTIDSAGNIRSGQTAYNTSSGFWIGNDSGTPKFSLGNPAGNYLTWDGSALTIKGSITLVNSIPSTSVSGLGALATQSSVSYGNITGTKPPENADVTLTAIQGSLTLTGGGLVLSSGGASIRGGQTAYNTGTGFWLGDVGSGTTKFSLGNPSGSYLTWDGSALTIKGAINATSLTLTGATVPAASVTGLAAVATSGSANDVGLGNVQNLNAAAQTTTGLQSTISINSGGISMGSGGFVRGGIDWITASNNFTASSSGFFLGYTTATAPTASAYRFFIGSTGTTGTGGTNYLYWDGTVLKIGGNIVGGTTVGTDSSSSGLIINSTLGIRKGNKTGTLTITGGDGNGISAGAQIDFGGNELADGSKGTLILQGGSVGGSLSNGRIEFRTNVGDSNGIIGSIRAAIRTDGQFIVYKNTVWNGSVNVYTTGAGCAEFQANVGVGRSFETIDGSGNTSGKLHVQTEIALYGSGNAQKVILSKNGTDSNEGIIYIKNNAGTTKVTLSAASGDVAADSFTTSSSRKFKTKIKPLNTGMEMIEKLKPVSFKRKGKNGKNDIGLIAEEVDEIIPVIVKHNNKNEAEGLDYSKLTVVLINAVKELSAEVKELKKKLKDANTN